MKPRLRFWTALASGLCGMCGATLTVDAQSTLPSDEFAVLTHEHTDGLCILYNPSSPNVLSLVAWQRDAELDLPTNQVIFAVQPQAQLTLPAGTPFGNAGQPLWILPQSQNRELLYLGVNSERVPAGVFAGPLTIALRQFEGPGYFMAWQATGPGEYTIRMNTRDGIDARDAFMPMLGAHEHFNWGFSAPGVYSATFQVSGQRIGESTNVSSLESTFVFHVRPLPSPTTYAMWAKSHWPPGFNPPTTLFNGNSDGDAFDNLREYAFNLSPTNADSITNAPLFSIVTNNGARYGALTFSRYKHATDLRFEPAARDKLDTGDWAPLLKIAGAPSDGEAEAVTARDHQPATGSPHRFFELNVHVQP